MFKLTEEQQLIVDTVRRIAAKEIEPRAKELDEKALFPEDAMKIFAEQGLLNPLLPAKYGGVELPVLTFVILIEEISKVCASTALLLIAQADGMLPIPDVPGLGIRLNPDAVAKYGDVPLTEGTIAP